MLRKFKIISATLLSGVCATSGHAVQSSPHEFTVGLLANYYQYRETHPTTNNFFMHLKGYMIGGLASYTYTTQRGFLFGAELDFSAGSADYDSDGTGSVNDVKQNKFESRLKGGKNFHLANGLTLTPYTGFGIRIKSDYTGGMRSSTGHHGYDRHSTYLYIPLGLKLKKQICSDWAIETTGEFDLFLYGNQKSDGLPDLEQHKGYGLRGNIEAIKTFSNKQALSFGPFVNFWDIKNSEISCGFMEPNNKTLEAGISVKYRF